ncbi:MAG: hypothetical protein KY454_04855 [Actinobacteria bacterium]|nr:hypothetical protein [Actinomycetota bacterium]MBW3649853.1 hypothetical protein [Actinomycetota bacterium]
MSNYGAPGGYEQPRAAGKATAALIVAIIGLFVCAPIGGVVALILAGQAAREIRESGGRLTGESSVKAARVIAIIEIALFAFVVLGSIIAIVVLGGSDEDLDDVQPTPQPKIVLRAYVVEPAGA